MRGLYTCRPGGAQEAAGCKLADTTASPMDLAKASYLCNHPAQPHLLLSKTGVDDKHNAIDGQTSLGNVSGNNDLAAGGAAGACRRRRGVKDALLLLRGEGGVEGVDLDGAHAVTQVVHLQKAWHSTVEDQQVRVRLKLEDWAPCQPHVFPYADRRTAAPPW